MDYLLCILSALSNSEGLGKMKINSKNFFHTSGGKISDGGNLKIEKKKLDNFKLNNKVVALKIDKSSTILLFLVFALYRFYKIGTFQING